jgi:CIC family chloride channel protein
MRNLLVKFLIWRIKHISDRNFILLLSSVVGALAGLAAVILKQSVHWIQGILTKGFNVEFANYFYLSYPLIGIFLTYFIAKYFLKEKLGHGITSILYDISKRSSKIPPKGMISRMITSALTVGFGGSVGLEAPIVNTGSAIGSNIGQLVHMNYKKRTILIGCGGAAAIAGIFNSPIAGVIFAIEVLLTDVTVATFIPILIAAVFGSLVSLLLLGEDVLFSFNLTDPFLAADVPFFILLGITTGLFAVYFTRMTYKVENLTQRIQKDSYRAIIGGIVLGLIIFVFPPIYGEGYETLNILLGVNDGNVLNNSLFFEEIDNMAFIVLFMLGVLFIKPVASAVTIGSGGSGGIFAPSLFVGGIAGFVFATAANVFLGVDLSVKNFVLVGMCGAMSGILHAPLTAIFLIAEITSGYTLFVPLMLVSAISYNAASYFEKYSLYTKHLIEGGDLIQGDKDRQVLSLINIKKLVETDIYSIHYQSRLGDLVNLVRKSKRNIYPVVDDENRLLGVITLDDIRESMFDPEAQENVVVNTIMNKPPAIVTPHENMQSVMNKFDITGAWNLPVIEDGKYLGFVSKSRIFNSYRKKLIRAQKE